MALSSGRILLLALAALALVVDRSPAVAFEDILDDIFSYFYDSDSDSESMEVISVGNKNVSIIVKCENCTVSLACDKCASMTMPEGMMGTMLAAPVTTPTSTGTPSTTSPSATSGTDMPTSTTPTTTTSTTSTTEGTTTPNLETADNSNTTAPMDDTTPDGMNR